MLQPKRTKFRKMQKGRMKGNAQRGATIAFGSFGLKSQEEGWITSRQIEAARIAVTRYMKREGQVWIRIFPDKPVTQRAAETRMGKGKGSPEGRWTPPSGSLAILERNPWRARNCGSACFQRHPRACRARSVENSQDS